MRADYVLYVIAVLLFIVAGVFVSGVIQLATTDLNLAATVVLFILGVIFAVGGYGLRPKAAAPAPMHTTPEPVVVESAPAAPQMSAPVVEEKVEKVENVEKAEEPFVVPSPVVETPPPVEEAPVAEPAPQTVPTVEEAPPAASEPAPVMPEVEVAASSEEAKPAAAAEPSETAEKKTVRRRRRKKAA